MYIKVLTDGSTVYPYTVEQLKHDHPNTSFPDVLPPALIAEFGVFEVKRLPPPSYNYATHALTEAPPVLGVAGWTQAWQVVELSAQLQEQRLLEEKQKTETLRRAAYAELADPLFFKAQRGEATIQEWLDKVAEIRARAY